MTIELSGKFKSDLGDGNRPSKETTTNENEYAFMVAQWMLSNYVHGNCSIPYSHNSWLDTMVAFASGTQPKTRYKRDKKRDTTSIIDKTDLYDDIGVETKQQGLPFNSNDLESININYDIASPATKIMNTLVQKLLPTTMFSVGIEASDPYSVGKIATKKAKSQLYGMNPKLFGDLATLYNEQQPTQEFEQIPTNENEAKQLEEQGAYKIDYCESMEKAVNWNLHDYSNWEELAEDLIKDMIKWNSFAVIDEINDTDNLLKGKRIDLRRVCTEYSEDTSHKDVKWGFYLEDKSYSEIRPYLANLSEDQLRTVIGSLSTYFKEDIKANVGNEKDSNKLSILNALASSKFHIMTGYFYDEDVEYILNYTGKNNSKKQIAKLTADEVVNKKLSKHEEIVKKSTVKMYQFKHVLGTQIIYDFKPVTAQRIDSRGNIMFPITVIRINEKSLTEQLIPVYDQFQILHIKYQETLAKFRGKGIFIDLNMLQNLVSNEDKDSGSNWLKMLFNESIGLGLMTDQYGRSNVVRPFSEIPGYGIEELSILSNEFVNLAQRQEDIVGLNNISLGATPDERQPVKTTSYALNTTSNTLRYITKAIYRAKKILAQHMVAYNLLVVEFYKESYLLDFLSDFDKRNILEAIENEAVLQTVMRLMPTDDEVQFILNAAEQAKQNGQITPDTALKILTAIKSGWSIKTAQRILSDGYEKVRKDKMEEQSSLAKEQSKAAQIGQETKLKEVEMQGANKLKEIEAKAKADIQTVIAKGKAEGANQVIVALIGKMPDGNDVIAKVEALQAAIPDFMDAIHNDAVRDGLAQNTPIQNPNMMGEQEDGTLPEIPEEMKAMMQQAQGGQQQMQVPQMAM